jgi:hypothetical protein
MLGFDLLHDWCFQTMWLSSGVPQHPEDETVMEMQGAEALYPSVESVMYAIQTEDHDARHGAAHWMIHNANLWMIRWW